MAYTFNWELKALRKANSDSYNDIIIGTNWKVTATDEDGYEGSFDGATPFKAAEINPSTFTEYASLTEEQVLGWVKSVVSGSNASLNYWDHIMGRIKKQIDEKKYLETRVDATAFPWSPTSGSASVTPNPAAMPISSEGSLGGTPS